MLFKTTRTELAALAAGCLFTCATGLAADPEPAQPYAVATSDRPRIGLVLAGGGAKGGAHVGVLKVLEEMRVPIDCIAGTSMGALVGAGYASGIPANALQEFLVEIDWKSVVGGLGQRDLQPIEQKRAGVTYSNNFELGLKDKRVVVPGGIVNTSGIEDLLRTYVARARMQSSFDRLPIPFRAVATDMITGEMVVLDKGDLATAMRASMAIPGAFAPVVTDEYILADGGMVRNIPVDVARELCADVVIVVNLVEPSAQREKLQSATQLLTRSTDVMLQANETLQLRTLTERDVRIDVAMGDIGTADFERVPDTIPLGEAATRAAADRLARLAVPEPEYLAWRQKVTASQHIEARLADVRYEGLERVNPAYLEQQAQVRAGQLGAGFLVGTFRHGHAADGRLVGARAELVVPVQDDRAVRFPQLARHVVGRSVPLDDVEIPEHGLVGADLQHLERGRRQDGHGLVGVDHPVDQGEKAVVVGLARARGAPGDDEVFRRPVVDVLLGPLVPDELAARDERIDRPPEAVPRLLLGAGRVLRLAPVLPDLQVDQRVRHLLRPQQVVLVLHPVHLRTAR